MPEYMPDQRTPPPILTLTHRTQLHAHTIIEFIHRLPILASHFNPVKNIAIHCNILQYAATHCNTLHHAATHYRIRSCSKLSISELRSSCRYFCVAACCSVLQRVAVRCSALQCVAVRCRVVQSCAVWCSVVQCLAVSCIAVQCIALQCIA